MNKEIKDFDCEVLVRDLQDVINEMSNNMVHKQSKMKALLKVENEKWDRPEVRELNTEVQTTREYIRKLNSVMKDSFIVRK